MGINNNLDSISNNLYQMRMLNHMDAMRYGENSKQAKRSGCALQIATFLVVFPFVLVILLMVLI